MKSPRTCVASALFLFQSHAFNGQFGRPVSVGNTIQPLEVCDTCDTARRSLLASPLLLLTLPATSNAAVDCFADCFKNCKLIAPKDQEYCQLSCKEYCDQPDRTDGLSGSISSEGGETGILGRSTAVKGEDKLPQVKLPGLNFESDGGRKLLGY